MSVQVGKKKSHSAKKTLHSMWEYRWIYLMLIPCIAYFVIFKYVPMYGIQLAFKDYVLKGIAASPWNDFAHLMSEPQFLPALRNTLIISFYRILFGFPFPILLAIMINEVYMPRYKKVLQTIYTFPHFLTWVVMAGIMLNLLGSTGMVRKICELFVPGIGENWNLLYNKSAFRSILVISDIWKEAGWGTIIYLASITGIDQSLYEVSYLNGATSWQRFRYVTFPLLSPTILFVMITEVIFSFQIFDPIYIMTKGGPAGATRTIGYYIYSNAFKRFDFGYAAALSTALFVIIMLLTLLQWYGQKRWVYYD